jgi:hypothetical protein
MNCGKAAVHYYLMSDVEVTCTELRRSTCTERRRSMVDVEILPPQLQSIHFGCAQCDGF